MGEIAFDDDGGRSCGGAWRGPGRSLSLDAGRYEVILPPSGVADMMGSLFFYAMGGQDAEDGRTVFSASTPSRAGGGRVGTHGSASA